MMMAFSSDQTRVPVPIDYTILSRDVLPTFCYLRITFMEHDIMEFGNPEFRISRSSRRPFFFKSESAFQILGFRFPLYRFMLLFNILYTWKTTRNCVVVSRYLG